MGRHDLSYRLFFSHRRMIQDLLREIVGERWVELIDFKSGELVDTTFISPRHENRESDLIWKFRRKDGTEPVFIYILMELQSQPDPSLSARLMSYIGMLYQRLRVNRSRSLWKKKMPLVIPVVVYEGVEPRDLREEITALDNPVAELFQFKRNRSWWETRLSAYRLQQRVPSDEVTLRRAFENWLAKVVLPSLSEEEAFETPPTLEEIETVLAENFGPELREEGRQEAGSLTAADLREVFKD